MNDKKPPVIRPANAAKGAAAELMFRHWLDDSVLPHLYVEQSPLTVPTPLRGEIKRPDYLVGIPGVGLIAFDEKAKTIFAGSLIFDLDEVRKLRTFARLFHLTVYFACLDPAGGVAGYWVRLDQLDFLPVVTRNGKRTVGFAGRKGVARIARPQLLQRLRGRCRPDLKPVESGEKPPIEGFTLCAGMVILEHRYL